jgi:hypothetical protein
LAIVHSFNTGLEWQNIEENPVIKENIWDYATK